MLDYPPRFQFGEVGAPCGGASACTDTCIKMIVEYYKEKTYSLAYIRKLAQSETSYNEGPCTGINSNEVLTALRKLGVSHYKVGFGTNNWNVWTALDKGPVIVGVHYGSYPKNRSRRCGSNNLAESGGRTDCPFTGAHAVLAVGKDYHTVNGVTHRDFQTRDPDHSSSARPEKPHHDRITAHQLEVAMDNLPRYTRFSNTYIIYPTLKKRL